MKLDSFLKEHGLKIRPFGDDDNVTYTLMRSSDGKKISPDYSMRDAVILWLKNNVNEVLHKLYNEEED